VALLPPGFLKRVVAIGAADDADNQHWIGSGFLYGRRAETDESLTFVYLITNRHVLTAVGSDKFVHPIVRANPKDKLDASKVFALPLKSGNRDLWIAHPDPDVDLAATLVNVGSLVQEHGIDLGWFDGPNDALNQTQMADAGLSEGDGVFVLGFPLGLVGSHRDVPLVRNGCISRVRDALAGATTVFLIDASVYPGNSGGPVVLDLTP
jgi:S1-C subfamily serine protease